MMAGKVNYCFQKAEAGGHKLYIYDDVSAYGKFNWSTWEYEESETSASFFRQQLEAIPETDTIEIHINSNGGSVKEGVAIYNQLKRHKAHKIGYVDGVAYSIAFVILQACDERIMGTGTSALVHNIWVEAQGNATELRKIADDLDVLMESNRQIFIERSSINEQQLIDMMDKETFLTPEQCLEFGFIDQVDSYTAREDSGREQLEKEVLQLRKMIHQQKSFREQIGVMCDQKDSAGADEADKRIPEKEETVQNLNKKLFNFFTSM